MLKEFWSQPADISAKHRTHNFMQKCASPVFVAVWQLNFAA